MELATEQGVRGYVVCRKNDKLVQKNGNPRWDTIFSMTTFVHKNQKEIKMYTKHNTNYKPFALMVMCRYRKSQTFEKETKKDTLEDAFF